MLWPLQSAPSWHDPRRGSGAAVSNMTTTPNGTAHAKGAWAQVVAALEEDVSLIVLRGNGAATSDVARTACIDIGVGAASGEQVVLEGFDIGQSASNPFWLIPLSIPAGSRVAARVQSSVTTNCLLSFDFYGAGGLVGGGSHVAKWTTYGFNAAASTGTAVTPGNTNTWGSWVQVGTTSSEHDHWMFTGTMGNNSATTAITYRTQWAFGANSTEAGTQATNGTHIEGPMWTMSTSEAQTMLAFGGRLDYCPVPSGAGIWCRAMASGTAQTVYVTAYGGN